MESTTQSPMEDANKLKVGRKKVRPKALKDSALAAGLAALQELESSEIAARPAKITAKTFVEEAIGTIIRLRQKGVPLLRIYTDARKAAGLRISFPTFEGYVSSAAKKKGLRQAKSKESTAPVQTPATAQAEAWACSSCPDAVRRESTKTPGAYYWKCPSCGTFYFDNNGKITSKRMGG